MRGYTLHPTPYTLHPTPYTLHPTPYTLKPRRNKQVLGTHWAAKLTSLARPRLSAAKHDLPFLVAGVRALFALLSGPVCDAWSR